MDGELKRVSVIGLGKLGEPMVACFAARGFTTVGVDVDARKVQSVNEAKPAVYEPGLQDLMAKGRSRISATGDFEKAILNTDVTFVIVPTPSEPKGGFSLKYALEAAKTIGLALRKKKDYHLVVLTSTVMPGATEAEFKPVLEQQSGKKCGKDFGLCYNPEFIALGSVIRDFLHPDFLLIGEADSKSGELLSKLLKSVCENDPPVARMSIVNAELAKLSVNTFVTTKITFANLLARICERLPGANVDVVTSAIGLDTRIGRKYLKGAIGYGGPCFPRDNLALVTVAKMLDVPALLPDATDAFNRQQVGWLAALVRGRLPKGGKVGILGLAYKPDSEVVEESQGLQLADLLAASVPVVAYDPAAIESARRVLGSRVKFAASAEECLRETNVVVVMTPWPQFKTLPAAAWSNPPHVLVDCWRMFDKNQFGKDVEYLPLGVGL